MNLFKFKADAHGENWFAIGYNDTGDECWTHNGIILDDKKLVERIAANMQKAYNQGLEDAAKHFVQEAIKVAKAGSGHISNTTTLGGYVVKQERAT